MRVNYMVDCFAEGLLFSVHFSTAWTLFKKAFNKEIYMVSFFEFFELFTGYWQREGLNLELRLSKLILINLYSSCESLQTAC